MDNSGDNRCAETKETEENCFGEIEEMEDVVDKSFKKFKRFQVVPFPPNDHEHERKFSRQIFAKTCGLGMHVSSKCSFAKRMKKDWDTLENNLPSSIFVRTYGSRIDLMRACVAGLEGSPCCYGLFFFDILFPTDYPAKPPQICFRSYDFELKPNLLKDGTVGLNLVRPKLWYQRLARKEEDWDPNQSDILQVLLRIQHVTLNPRPELEGPIFVHNSTEKVLNQSFMASCEAMLRTLESPPQGFEELVKGHFRKRSHPILLIYKDQMEKHGNNNNNKAMKRLFFKLVRAFEANGAYCQHHYSKAELVEAIKDEDNLEDKVRHHNKLAKQMDYLDLAFVTY